MSQADEGAVRIPKDRPSYFDISKVPIDGQMSNAFNDNICFIYRRLVSPQQELKVGTLARLARPASLSFRSPKFIRCYGHQFFTKCVLAAITHKLRICHFDSYRKIGYICLILHCGSKSLENYFLKFSFQNVLFSNAGNFWQSSAIAAFTMGL